MSVEKMESEGYDLDASLAEVTDATEVDFPDSKTSIESFGKLDINDFLEPTTDLLKRLETGGFGDRNKGLTKVMKVENKDKPKTDNKNPSYLNLVPNGEGFSLEYNRKYLTPYYTEKYGKKIYKPGVATFTLSYNKANNSLFVMYDIGGKTKDKTIRKLTPDIIEAIENLSTTLDNKRSP